MTGDLELLHQYALENRQDAFAELVQRHLRLVYTSALRQVRSPELAEEVAQSVFADLARHHSRLKSNTILTAWLYQITRRTSIDVIRRESRRQKREKIALDMNPTNQSPEEWQVIEPILDEAMETLSEPDRTAILLRYFEEKSLREIGLTLGASEDAAQKRVSRALEQLREFFHRRGNTVGAAGLAGFLTAQNAQAMRASLTETILRNAATKTGLAAVANTIYMTAIQKTLVVIALAATVGACLYEGNRAAVLQHRLETMPRPSIVEAPTSDALRQQLEETARRLAEAQSQNEKLLHEQARLRNELARRKDNQTTPGEDDALSAQKAWMARLRLLKDRMAQHPEVKIPEFKFLTDEDWLSASRGNLNTDDDFRRAFSQLRNAAESTFLSSNLSPGLTAYFKANNQQFPTDVTQLQPYFDSAVDTSILQRWEIVPHSVIPNLGVGPTIITQIAAVDSEYDSRYAIGASGSGTTGNGWDINLNDAIETMKPVLKAYAAANNGNEPLDESQLAPYLTTSGQQAAFQYLTNQNQIKHHTK